MRRCIAFILNGGCYHQKILFLYLDKSATVTSFYSFQYYKQRDKNVCALPMYTKEIFCMLRSWPVAVNALIITTCVRARVCVNS